MTTLSGKEPNGWNGARTVIRNCLSLLTNLRQKLICLRYAAGAPEINVAMITRPRVGVRSRCFHLCVIMGRQSTLFSNCVTREIFKEYIEDILAPTLPKGSILIMDNHRAHKQEFDSKLLRRHQNTVKYLLPYSPD